MLGRSWCNEDLLTGAIQCRDKKVIQRDFVTKFQYGTLQEDVNYREKTHANTS